MKTLHTKIFNPNSKQTPLIILHGLFGSSDNWNTLAKKFSESRPVYAVDLRNHGESFWSDDMSLEVMSHDLDYFMKEYHLDKADILGHSLGGKVLLQFISDYEEKLEKAIIVDIAPKKYPPYHKEIIEALENLDTKTDNSRKKIDEQLAKRIPNIDVRQFLMKNIQKDPNNQYVLTLNIKSIAKNYISLLAETKLKQNVQTPILFIKGENSEYINKYDIEKIKNDFPNSNIISIEGAGHWVHAEQSRLFYEIVNDFLKTN